VTIAKILALKEIPKSKKILFATELRIVPPKVFLGVLLIEDDRKRPPAIDSDEQLQASRDALNSLALHMNDMSGVFPLLLPP